MLARAPQRLQDKGSAMPYFAGAMHTRACARYIALCNAPIETTGCCRACAIHFVAVQCTPWRVHTLALCNAHRGVCVLCRWPLKPKHLTNQRVHVA
eukprot:1159772-Pelagomonas_calceolata.AAC.4